MLRVKLKHIQELTEERERITKRYLNEISNRLVVLPKIRNKSTHVWHLFVIQCDERDRFQEYLNKNGIGSMVHYPIPPHLSEAYNYLGYKEGDFPIAESYAKKVLSIPLYNGMKESEIDYVIEKINSFS